VAITQPCKTSVVKSYTLAYQYQYSNNCAKTLSLVQARPISIAISAESSYFQYYSSGILTKCGTTINHAVNLVGVVQNSTGNYWIVKNSWGTGWG
jgi:C1A family cysteine protease